MNINLKLIENINNFLIKGIKINFTFLNLVDSLNIKKRLLQRKKLNRYDKFKLSFYKKVQSGFVKIAKKNKKKYLLINSNLPINTNKKKIINKIKTLI